MEIKMNSNIYFKSFKTQKELKTLILTMIMESKIDKVLYKGEPNELNYKLLKKIMLAKTSKNKTNVNPDEIKTVYNNIINEVKNEPYCVIYKK